MNNTHSSPLSFEQIIDYRLAPHLHHTSHQSSPTSSNPHHTTPYSSYFSPNPLPNPHRPLTRQLTHINFAPRSLLNLIPFKCVFLFYLFMKDYAVGSMANTNTNQAHLNPRHKGQAKEEQTFFLSVCLVLSCLICIVLSYLSCLVMSALSVLDSKLDAVQLCHDAKCRELLTLTLTPTLILTVFEESMTRTKEQAWSHSSWLHCCNRLIFLVS